MGTVLRFPSERVRGALYPVSRPAAADVMILPVVRIERGESPAEGTEPGEHLDPRGRGNGVHGGRRRPARRN